MRLWTLHPSHLDPQGLVALWREGLLARAVLRGATRGYRHHPQLARFRAHASPVTAINVYLAAVHADAARRGYTFDRGRIGPARPCAVLVSTRGQLEYEWEHLLAKLRVRHPPLYDRLLHEQPTPHPCFRIVAGGVEPWERPR